MSLELRGPWLTSLADQNPALAAELQILLTEHDALGKEGFLRAGPETPLRPPSLVRHSVGAYRLESPIGQGGMGTVWLARRSDGRFEGSAAVKFLNFGLLGGAGERRFKREGSFLARLAHPNIAHLIDAGVSATGQPYLILEHVDGQHIDAYCNERGLDLRGPNPALSRRPGGRGARPRQPDCPPRPQAFQRVRYPSGPGETAGLWDRQAGRGRSAPGRDGADPRRRKRAQPRLRGARASGSRSGHHRHRCVFTRSSFVPAADRKASGGIGAQVSGAIGESD